MHPNLERELARERAAQMRKDVGHNRLDARSAREHRLSRAAVLSEEARLAKARMAAGAAGRRGGTLARGATFAVSLFGLGSR